MRSGLEDLGTKCDYFDKRISRNVLSTKYFEISTTIWNLERLWSTVYCVGAAGIEIALLSYIYLDIFCLQTHGSRWHWDRRSQLVFATMLKRAARSGTPYSLVSTPFVGLVCKLYRDQCIPLYSFILLYIIFIYFYILLYFLFLEIYTLYVL